MRKFLQNALTTVTDWTNTPSGSNIGQGSAQRPTSASRAQLFDQLWATLQSIEGRDGMKFIYIFWQLN